MKPKIYKLANPKAFLPMPDKGGTAFPVKGRKINPNNPYYRLAIKQGDLIEAKSEVSPAAQSKSAKTEKE